MKAFYDIFEDDSRNGTKLKTDEYCVTGKNCIIDQGKELVAGYTDREEGLYIDVPAIIFGDHTRIIKYIDKPFFLGADGVKILKSKVDNSNYKYLYYALKNAKIPDTGYNRHFKWLKEVQIKYPNSDIQADIVRILDKVSEIISKRHRQLNELDMLVKARFIEMFENKEYEKVQLSNICDFITKGTTPQSNQIYDIYKEGLIPYLKVYNLSFTGELLFKEKPQYISKEVHDGKLSRSKVYPNDVLMNIVGPPLGKFSIVTDEFKEWNINQAIAIFRAKEKIIPIFLIFYCIINRYI